MAATRQRLIYSLINRRVITSQAELVGLLAQAGYQVTQATVSRDLRAIGAAKVRDARGRLRYVIPSELPPDQAESTLERALEDFALAIAPSAGLVVLRTSPGAAHVVAAAIDVTDLAGVLGTVAGDDTLIVVADEQVGGWRVAEELERIGAGR